MSCRIRVSTAGTERADEPCPGCGLSLEPVAKLTEVLGFRSAKAFDASHLPRVAQRVSDISDGRAAAADAQRETDRLLAVGLALPRPQA
jgi:hypothetical protein